MKCPNCEALNSQDSRYCFKCATPLPLLEETLPIPEAPTVIKAEISLGATFAGKYEILEKLGQGGMGVVYKAMDTKLNRPVALKFLPLKLTVDPEFKRRFIQEARAASATEHQNICTIYEIDETAAGQIYIGMALYQGETVKDKIKRGPLSLDEAIGITTQLARGLSKAHHQAIVHRDIKPANIMVTNDGVIKILDFGLAKFTGQSERTSVAQVVGTVSYMSPEQARGEDVDHRTDLWSAGVVFFEMLTGQLPFKGNNDRAFIYSLLNDHPVLPSEIREDIPGEAEEIIFKCLEKSPQDRYNSADSLLEDLTKLKGMLAKRATQIAIGKENTLERTRETERRLATIMFAEISGYSEMLKAVDVEEAPQVISRCLAMLNSSCQKYDGKVDKLTENTSMVVFGVPRSVEDAPKKAINAAIELRESLAQFNQEKGLKGPLAIQIGIYTGIVIAGPLGPGDTREYSIRGEPVELALQLKDASLRGEICVGALTHRYTKNEFDYQELRPMAQKEKRAAVPIYRLLSAKARVYRARLGSERMIFSEMVGRSRELDKLKLHVLKAINGEGSIVNIIGEAGIGKSRLIAELTQQDETKRVNFLLGRALSFGQNLSFHPLIDILKSWAGITEDDTPSGSSQKLELAICNVYPDGVTEVFPFIATLMGIKLAGRHAERIEAVAGESLEKLIMKNLRELIVKVALSTPIVFVIEDLHWADLSSIDLLGSLYRLAENNRILFINVFRPNYEETSERLLRTIRTRYPKLVSDIFLEPLDENQCETLVENLLHTKDLPEHIMGLIAKQTEGNPFFIEEVARSFIDDGVVEKKDGHFYVTDKIDSVIIPETVHDVIMARVDKLDEQTKSLLKIASVIGRYFYYSILTEVAKSIREIDDKLEYLKEVQLIRERRRQTEIEYLFKRALARESVYSSILLKRRKELHLSVARTIEQIFRGRLHEFYGMLALHYSKGEDLEKAEEYLTKAGEEALKAAASSEAIHYYQEALRLYLTKPGRDRDPETVAHLEWNLAKALHIKGLFAEAVIHFDRLLKLWGERRPRIRLLSFLYFLYNLVKVLRSLYLPSRTIKQSPSKRLNNIIEAAYQRGQALATVDTWRMVTDSIHFLGMLRKYDLNQVTNGVTIYAATSALFFYSGISFQIAHKLLEYARSFIKPQDRKSLFNYEFYKLAMDALFGDWDINLKSDAESVDRSVQDGDLFSATVFILFQGIVLIEQGNIQNALDSIHKLEMIGDVYENTNAKTLQAILQIRFLLKTRKVQDAVAEANESIPRFIKAGQKFWALHLTGLRANAQLLQGDLTGAKKSLNLAEKLLSQEKRISPLYVSPYRISRFLMDVRAFEEALSAGNRSNISRARNRARQSCREMLRNARQCAPSRTEALKLAGIYCWLSGKPKQAFDRWQESIEAGQELRAQPELGRTYLEIGRRLLEKGRLRMPEGLTAQDYLAKARAVFESLNLTWDLKELEQA